MLSANDVYMTEMLTLSGNDDQAMSSQKHELRKAVRHNLIFFLGICLFSLFVSTVDTLQIENFFLLLIHIESFLLFSFVNLDCLCLFN